uniref:Rho-GAP domain-containing protein n=1 Tax=Stegastes partitus TaxID=144197 RepID=A0A3B5AI12_9TELE
MRYRRGVVGAGGGDKSPKAENSLVSVCGVVGPCPILAFQAAVRLREEIKALRGVFILNITGKFFLNKMSEIKCGFKNDLYLSFLVDACSFLLERAGNVGLFRKSGSLPRIKTLRAKLNCGEECLSTALPYDVATLIKQFCRELPEPLFPSEIHTALLKAQEVSDLQDRMAALQLLSCLLPARNSSCLHYLFDFLYSVSQRTTTLFGKSQQVCFSPAFSQTHTVIRSVRTMPWIQGRSKLRPPVSEQSQSSTSADRPTLRRSHGMETFLNVHLFRASMQLSGKCSMKTKKKYQVVMNENITIVNLVLDQSFRPAAALLNDSKPANKDSCKTPQGRLKR